MSWTGWNFFINRVGHQTPSNSPLTGGELCRSSLVKGRLGGVCRLLICRSMRLTECLTTFFSKSVILGAQDALVAAENLIRQGQ
jgi:hypothetical protein